MNVLLPRLADDSLEGPKIQGIPAWIPLTEAGTGSQARPVIRCNCGELLNMPFHHFHPDGSVTASIMHACGWHVFASLAHWTGAEYLPGGNP